MGQNLKKLRKDDISKYYDIGGKLGTGSFATVKLATRKNDGKKFAVKIIKKSKLSQDELAVVHDEVEIMHKIDHENIVHLYEMFETNKKLYMVMELLTGGELFDRIVAKGSYSEREAATVIRDVAAAIEYLHSVGVVHRDLKPENLLYLHPADDSPIKITDFGLAKFKGSASEAMTTACGTPGYVAPEVLKNEPYTTAVDLWSLGVILYILLCGFPPFYSEHTAELYEQIKRGNFDFPDPYWTEISSSAKNLVKGLLNTDPKKRLTATQVLKHPWIAPDEKEAAPSKKALPKGGIERLKLFQARQKLRRGVQLVLAVNKFSALINASKAAAAAIAEQNAAAPRAAAAPRVAASSPVRAVAAPAAASRQKPNS